MANSAIQPVLFADIGSATTNAAQVLSDVLKFETPAGRYVRLFVEGTFVATFEWQIKGVGSNWHTLVAGVTVPGVSAAVWIPTGASIRGEVTAYTSGTIESAAL